MIYVATQKNGPLDITFPYKGVVNVAFTDGWLPQGDNESYRWIKKSGEISLKKGKWSSLYIEGYVPDNFAEVNSIRISINGEIVFETDLKNRDWKYEGNIPKDIQYGDKMQIKIEYNDVHYPDVESKDIRELSGMINEIRFN